ncbi:MAG TPA: chemotaxis protein CheW [Gemmatimonadaceae bacterium]|nr:chemotaxis protein CheW [Gemmatimonadaceae bacterium]
MLAFDLAQYRLALLVESTREVLRAVWIEPLPQAPPDVEGVINVRGTLIPVIDLRERLGLPPEPIALDQHMIIADAGPRRVALRVDRALDVRSVAADAIDESSAVDGLGPQISGIARLDDGLLIIADLDRFLSGSDGVRVDAAIAARAAGRPDSTPAPGDS